MEIGEFLKKLRTEKGFTFRVAAEKSGLSHSYIRYIEIGKRPGSDTPINPTPETLKRLAKAYEYDYDDLMEKAGYIEEDEGSSTTEYEPLSEINKLIKEFGIEQFGFFDIEKWKQFTPEDVDELRRHFEWVSQKAKERNEEKE